MIKMVSSMICMAATLFSMAAEAGGADDARVAAGIQVVDSGAGDAGQRCEAQACEGRAQEDQAREEQAHEDQAREGQVVMRSIDGRSRLAGFHAHAQARSMTGKQQ